jgi:hypothetical protein
MPISRPARWNRTGQGADLSREPSFDIDDPDDGARGHGFMLQTLMEMERSHGALAQSNADLAKTIDLKTQRLDKIDDLRVDLKGVSTTLDSVQWQGQHPVLNVTGAVHVERVQPYLFRHARRTDLNNWRAERYA